MMSTLQNNNNTTLGDIIKSDLLDTNKTLLQFSENSDISYSTIRRIVKGKTNVSRNTYYKLGKYLNIKPSELAKLPLK